MRLGFKVKTPRILCQFIHGVWVCAVISSMRDNRMRCLARVWEDSCGMSPAVPDLESLFYWTWMKMVKRWRIVV